MIGELIKRLRPIRYYLQRPFHKKHASKISGYKNSRIGESVTIVCNGPSLNSTDLHRINMPTIGMNKINLIFEKQKKWRPDYIICSNGLVINQNKEFFENYSKPVFLDFKAAQLGVKGHNIHYFLSSHRRYFSKSFDKEIGSAGTVTFAAIQLAYFLGFKNIYIVGMDHNYKGHSTEKSFSKIERFQGDDLNHFDPNYFKGNLWGTPNLFISEYGYKISREFLEKNKVNIYDCTINGKCEIFEKKSINSIYS
ncbi:DUF115 domain-containing protein [Flavobacteriaceae bacterium]|nr:DUF115 domain-containing protein [Flavobacteriaceae bacterium]